MESKRQLRKSKKNSEEKPITNDILKEPSETARSMVTDKIHFPGGPGRTFCRTPSTESILDNIASNCITNCSSNCGSNCSSNCGSNCSSNCGSNCSSNCGSNCSSNCGSNCSSDCGTNCAVCPSEKLEDLYERFDRLETLVDVKFGDVEKILERISLNLKNPR